MITKKSDKKKNYTNFTFGFLSTFNNPLFPQYLVSALNHGCRNIIIICDEMILSSKTKRLLKERIRGRLNNFRVDEPKLYTFENAMLPFNVVKNHNNRQILSIIESLGIDCLFNTGTPRILKKRILNSCEYGVVNIHPGLFPHFRGCSNVEWAIYNDDRVGNSAHFMNKGIDTGPIITTEWYKFPKSADYKEIRKKVYYKGFKLAGKVLSSFKKSKIRPSDATHHDKNQGIYYKPISVN